MNENMKPARLVPPGAILKRELEARDWSQRQLADLMERPQQAISEIIQGTKQITPETAIELADALGTSAELWMNLESRYRLQLAQQKRAKRSASTKSKTARNEKPNLRETLKKLVPLNELLKRGWIKETASLAQLEREICKFLGIKNVTQEPQLAASWRHSQARKPESTAQLAWLKRVEAVAKAQKVGSFDRAKLEKAIPSLLAETRSPERIPDVLKKLKKLGVRIALVEHLPKTYTDGAAFFLDDGSPVIGITLRYDRIDHFWFTLLHELAHIVLRHKGVHVDALFNRGQVTLDASEQEANCRAQEWLFPQVDIDSFVQRSHGQISESLIEEFAAEHDRHPGLLVGQLQHRQVISYAHFRLMLVNVRPYLAEWKT